MISQDLLDILRCPLDPSHRPLSVEPGPGGSTAHRLERVPPGEVPPTAHQLKRVPPGERPPVPGHSDRPLESSGTRLSLEGDALVCQRCRLKFAIKDGIPNMVVEEAELPPGCESISQLPCQREAKEK
jgi:uncharacterized protein YbaR (Trm112 family)